MRQILQDLGQGETILADVPCPDVCAGHLLIRSAASLVSAGTERMLVEFGKAGFIEKARQQPDKVKQVLQKIKTDGLFTTLEAVKSKLAKPIPLGYSNAGVVLAVGAGVEGFAVGDRVVSNGPHAEVVLVPKNLCAKIPDSVSYESAAFCVVASIGLQGVRLVKPELGETMVVTGLGLIGLLTVQILRAHGCSVIGLDFDEGKLELARAFGAETVNLAKGEDPLAAAMALTEGRGVDGVVITAATKSNEPVHQAALMCRKRGRIVLVGVTGLELSRADFYEKELSFQVSCSYGAGRYDPEYEDKGHDYPYGLVRWTEQRNFEAVLAMLASGSIQIEKLISHHFDFDDAAKAYSELSGGKGVMGILLSYLQPESDVSVKQATDNALRNRTVVRHSPAAAPVVAGVIGAGNHASRMLIPWFKQAGASLHTVASGGGVSASITANGADFAQATTDSKMMIENNTINTVVIATRHNSHAKFVIESLKAGKHVFVEKPLCLTRDELSEIDAVYQAAQSSSKPVQLMLGYNRRFAPHIVRMKSFLEREREPKSFIMTMNAGAIPADHWTQDPSVGGGRILGEACHFIDLMRFLVGAPVTSVHAVSMGKAAGVSVTEDKATVTLTFEDGSFGTVHYFANGHRSFPKERIEVFCGEKVMQLDNFRALYGFGWPGMKTMRLWGQDKGGAACADAFVQSITGGTPCPIPYEEVLEVAKVTFDAVEQIRTRR